MSFFGLPPGSRDVVSAPVAIGMPPDIVLVSVFPLEVLPGMFPALVVMGRSARGQLILVFGRPHLGIGQWGVHPSISQ